MSWMSRCVASRDDWSVADSDSGVICSCAANCEADVSVSAAIAVVFEFCERRVEVLLEKRVLRCVLV